MELEDDESPSPLEHPYWPRLSAEQQEGPEHGKAVMCRTARYKYVRRLYERDELYDLQADPAELHNRSGDPVLAAVEAQLRDHLLTWFLETGDVVPPDLDRRG
jgi:arylsulfatase A-like enzyme